MPSMDYLANNALRPNYYQQARDHSSYLHRNLSLDPTDFLESYGSRQRINNFSAVQHYSHFREFPACNYRFCHRPWSDQSNQNQAYSNTNKKNGF